MALTRQFLEMTHYTEAEYFEFERTSLGRWEYVNGEIRELKSGTDTHGAIATNLICRLGDALVPQDVRMYLFNMMVRTGDGVYTFPDVAVVSGTRQYSSGKDTVILNPVLLIEVLSLSSESYDRGEKFEHYKTIASLQDYLLVDQTKAQIGLFTRGEEAWESQTVTGRDSTIYLPSVSVELALSDVYAKVKLGE